MDVCLINTIILFELSMACLFVRGDVCAARYNRPGDEINQMPTVYAYLETVTDDLRECAMGCMYLTYCKSVLYDPDSKHCQWFHLDKTFTNDWYTVEKMRLVYLEMTDWKQLVTRNPCADKPCADQERCVPLRSSYICEEFYPNCNTLCFGENHFGYFIVTVSSSSLSTSVEDIFFTGESAWVADQADSSPYVQVQFTSTFMIRGILTRGNPNLQTWITKYAVRTSSDCMYFSDILVPGTSDTMMFEGNTDAHTSKINYFEVPFYATCIRLMAYPYGNRVSMRMDVIGCYYFNNFNS